MFNFFHKVFSSFLTKPSVHYVKPKAINLFFKNSKNTKYHLLNLDRYSYVGIEATKEKQGEDNEYVLKLELHEGVQKDSLVVARFDNRQDLESAMLILKNKFYAPEKVLLKTVVITVATFVVLLFILNLIKQFSIGEPQSNITAANVQMMQQLQQMHQQGQIPQYQLPPAVANNPAAAYEALQQAKAQADQIVARGMQDDSNKIKQAAAGPAAVAPAPDATPAPVDTPQDPVQSFMKGLK